MPLAAAEADLSHSSPEYVRLSLAAAMTLGFAEGRFYRNARLGCINLLPHLPRRVQGQLRLLRPGPRKPNPGRGPALPKVHPGDLAGLRPGPGGSGLRRGPAPRGAGVHLHDHPSQGPARTPWRFAAGCARAAICR